MTAHFVPYALESFSVEIAPPEGYDEEKNELAYKLNVQYIFTAKVASEPTAKGTKYTWKYLSKGGNRSNEGDWKNISGGTKAAMTLKLTASNNNNLFKCEVSNGETTCTTQIFRAVLAVD